MYFANSNLHPKKHPLDFNYLYIKSSQASILIPLITGLRFYGALDRKFKILLLYFFISGTTEIIASNMKIIFSNNMPLLHIFTIIEFFLFATIYYIYFSNHQLAKRMIAISSFLFLLSAVLDATYFNGFWRSNTISHSVESIILVMFSLLYFFSFFKEISEEEVWKKSMFWLSSGVVIYFSINIFLFMLANYLLKKNYNLVDQGYNMHAFINIFVNIIFAISFICLRKKTP